MSVLTHEEAKKLRDSTCMNDPLALIHATELAVLSKLAAGVSVEPFSYAKWEDHPSECVGDIFYYGPNETQPEGRIPLYTATAIAAARVQENERCLAMMDAIGCDWRDAGDMAKFYATNYLREAIRALLGKEPT